jgi:prepilin-type N-terminal cleavage/methylation domain-containing protein
MGQRCVHRAFTLLEMLVCITVIGVLVGLLMPALSRVRASRDRTGCLANLRTLGQAVQMYRGDFDGLLPFADRPVDVRLEHIDPLMALAERLDVQPPSLDARGATLTGPSFACPSDDDDAAARGTSYWYTPHDLMALWPRPFAQRAVTIWLERDPMVVIFHDSGRWHAGGLVGVPLTGMNVLRLDGGAEAGHAGLSVNPRH